MEGQAVVEVAVVVAVVSVAAGSAVFCRQAKRVMVYQSEDRKAGWANCFSLGRLGLKQLTP